MPSRLEVDDQLELGRLLNWKIRGLDALENLVDVAGDTSLRNLPRRI
jgi:hypothetical protein